MVTSELTHEDKQYVIDVAIYDYMGNDDSDSLQLDYRDEDAELILDKFLIVAQDDVTDTTRKIVSMTMAAENFIEEGHTELKLQDGIFHAYMKVHGDDVDRSMKMLQRDLETAENLLP